MKEKATPSAEIEKEMDRKRLTNCYSCAKKEDECTLTICESCQMVAFCSDECKELISELHKGTCLAEKQRLQMQEQCVVQ
jgi:hypothetical protein